MKTKIFFLFLSLSFFLAACGDDDSVSATTEQDDTITSSSPESSSEPLSSSSFIDASSSSELVALNVNGFSWSGKAGEYTINTGLAYAEWYMFNDSAEGGLSTITWPVPLGNDITNDAIDPVIDECGGICGTFNLNQGSMDHKPYAGVAFNLAGKDALPVDITYMWGICITYTSDATAVLELVLDDKKEAAINHDRPHVTLMPTSSAQDVCTVWEKFEQAGWGNPISIDEAVKSVVSIRFRIEAADSTTGKFNIMEIYRQTCCDAP